MSLVHTCELCGANAFDYLTELERHAGELSSKPQDWMPWNYRETSPQADPIQRPRRLAILAIVARGPVPISGPQFRHGQIITAAGGGQATAGNHPLADQSAALGFAGRGLPLPEVMILPPRVTTVSPVGL